MNKAYDGRETEARLENIKAQLDAVIEQRDALAAWKHEAMRELTALQQVTHGLAHGGDMCWDYSRDAKAVMDREPVTSLARRDARVKAEALEDFADCYDFENEIEEHVLRHVREASEAHRQQAESEA